MSITDVASAVFAERGWTVRPVSSPSRAVGVTKGTVSFKSLQTAYEQLKQTAGETKLDVLLSSSGRDLLVSANAGKKRGRPSEALPPKNVADLRDGVAEAIQTLEKLPSAPASAEVVVAKSVVESMVCVLKAADGDELACQSFGLFYRKLAATDAKPRVVLAFRLHAGTPIRVHDLRSCLQDTWADGAITIEETLHSVDSVALPLTAEGRLSLSHGNRPILVVTSVCPKA